MNTEELKKRDYIVAIDSSGSMSTPHKSGKTRWAYAQEQTEALARKCAEFDSDGIEIKVFASGVKSYNNTIPDKVTQIFKENEPRNSTDTAKLMRQIFEEYFERKRTDKMVKPITVLVVTDGMPDDQQAVANEIIAATKKLDNENEIGISFIQVGNDQGATKFLKFLDDELVKQGAKYDIVDCKTEDEMENTSLTDVLIMAVTD
jgi:hypothetical protein